jgi:uncharacterized LabA/DUF88 family protein
LYYGLLKGTSYKWLNPLKLVNQILPYLEIQKVDYFTADIKVFPNDSGKGNRQQLFYRAISTLPNLRIIKGRYTVHPVEMPLAAGFPFSSKKVKVMKFEEKGSDVNLACHMLRDAYQPNSIKTIVVISNDSDLEEPIKICAQELDKYVYVLNPHTSSPSFELKQVATKFISIRKNLPRRCQFPTKMSDSNGDFCKPQEW